MQTVRKYLVYEYVPTMERTFRSGTRESCVAQRSIYVIMSGNEETRSYINRVRSAMSSFFSDTINMYILKKFQTPFLCLKFFETHSQKKSIVDWLEIKKL